VYRYLQSYTDHFGLRPNIQLNAAVQDLRRIDGQWELVLLIDGIEKTARFDKLMVAVGTFHTPIIPEIENIDKFAGDVRHSITFSPSEQYKNKRVLIVGFHASGVDVGSSLAGIASKILFSRKNGTIILPKFGPDGRTFDQALTLPLMFFQMTLEKYLPRLWYYLLDSMCIQIMNKAFPGAAEKYRLLPAPSMETTTPLIVDQIWPFLESGFVELTGAVKRVTGPRSVELMDGTILEDLDAIIYCTGYRTEVPWMPQEWQPVPSPGDPPSLYQNIFPLHSDPEVRNSLAFMGQGATPFPGFAMLETVAMTVAQVWKGKVQLPPLEEMQSWYQNNVDSREAVKKRMKYDATYYPLLLPLGPWWSFLDKTSGTDIIEHFSWTSWKSWSFWWRDRELYQTCKQQPLSPAVFRLFQGDKRKAWAGARSQILYDHRLAEKRSQIKLERDREDKKER